MVVFLMDRHRSIFSTRQVPELLIQQTVIKAMFLHPIFLSCRDFI